MRKLERQLDDTAAAPAVPAIAGVMLCLLLAVAQVGLGGYQLGVGNQAIQIAFLKKCMDPSLYPTDAMVNETMGAYPTYFFRILAPLAASAGVERLYVGLHILTSFAALAAVYLLGRSIYRSHASALAGAALLAGGHLRALAGDAMYSPDFTHTFVALPAAVLALALAYRGRWLWAFGVAGALFNLHALTAAYVLFMLLAGMLADFREMPRREWWVRGFLCGALALALCSPTLALLSLGRQTFDTEWVNLMRIRSAEHSFPSTWWASGNADVPRFVLIFALFVLSWSFSPVRRGEQLGGARRGSRLTVWMTLAVMGLFLAGWVFTEIYPVPLVIRLQPFRASRLLMVLMLVHIAHGAVAAIRAGIKGIAEARDGGMIELSAMARVMEVGAGVVALLAVGVPGLPALLPAALLMAMAAGLLGGHLSWRQAAVGMTALFVALLAWRQIDFALWPSDWAVLAEAPGTAGGLAWMAILVAAILAALMALASRANSGPAASFSGNRHPAMIALMALTLVAGSFFGGILFEREKGEHLAGENIADVASWVRQQTPTEALFLTPTGLGNFRIAAERSLVGDWRDGTQLYFSAGFGPEWIERVRRLEPGLEISDDGRRLITRGEPLSVLDDHALVDLAADYRADYIVLPTAKSHPRTLTVAFAGERYTVYEPTIKAAPVPPGVIDAELWRQGETFMATTVQQNIEKYRKADLTVQIVDGMGRPIQNLHVKLDQTKQAFVFGASLGFFEPTNIYPDNDLKPPPVTPIELEKMPEIFNGSMIPFSSKWVYIEPSKGQYRWSDLDKYVDYCTQHDITMEFHHLTGVLPRWVMEMGGVDGQRGLSFPPPIPALQTEFNRHCLDTVARYADRIKYFQVVNEKYMMQYVPAAFRLLKEKFPETKFGLSDCVKFWDGGNGRSGIMGWGGGGGNGDEMKGADAVDWLIRQGIKPDFFSVHGHYPLGLWADPQEMYRVFDYFQERGVKVHCTEEYLQLGGPIYGPMRSGSWTPALQAEYLARYLTIAFSHPDVDMVNLWGLPPNGWGASSSGLLDSQGKTRPAWDTLKTLFTETWRSHVSAPLGLDGSLSSRVFHGTYHISVRLADGREVTATAIVPQQASVRLQLRLDAAKGTLEVLNGK